jgi:hypothetical protein
LIEFCDRWGGIGTRHGIMRVRALSFAIGVYLPSSTTLPIFIGGAIRGIVQKIKLKRDTLLKRVKKTLKEKSICHWSCCRWRIVGVIFAFLNIPEKLVV